MITTPTMRPKKSHQTHVYLGEEEYAALFKVATRECRSVTGQILYYVKRGLEEEQAHP